MSDPQTAPQPQPRGLKTLSLVFRVFARCPLALLGPFAGLVVLGGAAPSPVAQAFGGTIVSTYPDGRTAELWLKPDGGYSAKGRRGDGSSGHWKINGEKLCLTQSSPLPIPFSFCTGLPAGGLHQAWSSKAVSGEPIRVKLVKGRFEGKTGPAPRAAPETRETGSQEN